MDDLADLAYKIRTSWLRGSWSSIAPADRDFRLVIHVAEQGTGPGVSESVWNRAEMAYIANTPDDIRVMLETIGIDSLEQLFDMVPAELRLRRPLAVAPALTELELTNHVSGLLAQNQGADRRVCFLGAGCYDHFIPAVVDNLASRGEFYTAYTPYQAEASQGTLQATFEYQTLITQLTGMEVSNASLYDGGSAVAEAMLMAMTITRRFGRVVIPETVHPEYRQIAATFLAHLEPKLVTVPAPGGTVDAKDLAEALTDDTAAVVLQHPNVFGQLEDIEHLIQAIHAKGALAIVSVDPISLGLLRRPGGYGADIVVAEGQGLGNPMSFGGPYLGIMACREDYLRKMPGRIVGQTTDRHGKRCWVLTLQTREQHIRREKATSNICTNQGLAGASGQHLPGRDGTRRTSRGGRTVDPKGPLRRRAARRRPGSVPGVSRSLLQGIRDPVREAGRADPGGARRAGLSRRHRPGPLVPRAGRLHPDRRDREADPGRDRRTGRGLRAGPVELLTARRSRAAGRRPLTESKGIPCTS